MKILLTKDESPIGVFAALVRSYLFKHNITQLRRTIDLYTEINVVDVFVQPIKRMLSFKYRTNSSPIKSVRSVRFSLRAESV